MRTTLELGNTYTGEKLGILGTMSSKTQLQALLEQRRENHKSLNKQMTKTRQHKTLDMRWERLGLGSDHDAHSTNQGRFVGSRASRNCDT